MSESSFEISPSIPVNGLFGTYDFPGGIPMSMNANYFPNTDIPLEGPIFWKRMTEETQNANEIIELFLFQLVPVGVYSNIWFKTLKDAVKRGVKVSCVYSASNDLPNNKDAIESTKFINELKDIGCDMVRFDATQIFSPLTTNFSGKDNRFYNETKVYGPTVVEPSSQIHVKAFMFDKKTFYIGSANTDYGAAREFGIWITDETLTNEMRKQYLLNYDLAKSNDIIKFAKDNLNIDITHENANEILYNHENWPEKYQTKYNSKNMYKTTLTNKTMNSLDYGIESDVNMYLTASPMVLCPKGWDWDYLGWMNVVNSAKTMLYISNFDFSPTTFAQMPPDTSNDGYVCTELASEKNWPFCAFMVAIENAVKRGVQVRLIGGSGFPHRNRDYLVPWAKKVNEKAKDPSNNWKGSISVAYWPVSNFQLNPPKTKTWKDFPASPYQPSQWLKNTSVFQPGFFKENFELPTPEEDVILKKAGDQYSWQVQGGTLHEKFAVSDSHVLISTNNLASGYFSITTGMSIVIETTDQLRDEVQNWFNAFWYGPYSSINTAKFEYNNQLCDSYSCPREDTLIGYTEDQAKTGICTSLNSKINQDAPYRIKDQNEWAGKPVFCFVDKPEPEPSTSCTNNPCKPYICTEGKDCIVACNDTKDCLKGYHCENNKCKRKKPWILFIILILLAIIIIGLFFFLKRKN